MSDTAPVTRLPGLALTLLFCVAATTACLSSDLHVLVRPDGSGTITHTLRISRSGLDHFNPLASAQQPLRQDNSALSRLPDAARIAMQIGRSVRLVTSRGNRWPDGEGRTAVYAFDSLDGLFIDAAFPVQESTAIALHVLGMDIHQRLDTRLGFALTPGADGTVVLTVRFADQRLDPSAGPARIDTKPENSPEDLAALRALVKGARTTLTVETETPLIRTNSPYSERNRVTLFDFDIERIALGDEVDKLWGFQPASLDEIRWALHDLPGATLALDRDITLEFEGRPRQGAAPAQPLPDTEIYLAPLTTAANGAIAVGPPVNITNSPGYDNQPSFDPAGGAIFFTSVRGGPSNATDIYRYDIARRSTSRVTSTPESEYSPTVMPGGRRLSVVRVEPDGTQRLWSFTLDGRDPGLVLTGIKPVGYHVWAGDQSVALFVLGSPPTLQLADTRTGSADVIARDVGRSLQPIPSGGVSFVQRRTNAAGAPLLTVMQLDPAARSATPLIDVMSGESEPYLAWLPDGALLVAHGDALYSWRAGQPGWRLVADLAGLGLRGVTRLAVSPRGDHLAMVGRSR